MMSKKGDKIKRRLGFRPKALTTFTPFLLTPFLNESAQRMDLLNEPGD